MVRFTARTRDERGATALLFAALALVLLGVSAVAVDVGQVYGKRAALQSNVDLAVLAAAAELTSAGACNPEVVAAAEDYLVSKAGNLVPDQTAIDLGGSSTDGNGFIQCNNWRVDLWAPTSRVDFGLARAVTDEAGVDVPAHAAAQIKSPGARSLPMYAVSGCDIGLQTISDPPPGPPPSTSPPATTPVGDADMTGTVSITPAEVDSGTATPFPVTVSGKVKDVKGWTAEAVFYNAGGPTTYTAPGSGTVPDTSGSGPKDFTIGVTTVPAAVLAANGIWWVRVRFTSPTGAVKWSKYQDSASFTVGELLFCNGTVSGNFGTLKIARTDVVAGKWLEVNIIKGLQTTLAINASSAVPCSPEMSTHVPEPNSNCIGTDPGFPNSAATDGFINGSSGYPGRLKVPTTPGCDRNGGSSLTTDNALNDDVLTCYIADGHTVGDVIAGTSNILSASIFSSPRFFTIPVIPVQAAMGSSGSYPVIGYRPGFITEEASTAYRGNSGASGDNGIHFHSGHVSEVKVTLFPMSALPETAPPDGGEIDYTGSGTKVIVLVE